jgi:hypothetical protein
VIADRRPSSAEDREDITLHHNAIPDAVQTELQKQGFSIVSRDDTFIHQPGDEFWWLLVASKQ